MPDLLRTVAPQASAGSDRSRCDTDVRNTGLMAETISPAASDEDYLAFASLIGEYFDWLRTRYAVDAPWLIDAVGSHQGIDEELRTLSDVYSPPRGKALLAIRDADVVGAGGYRDLGDGTCEMKRVFVPDRHQGRGIGRRLCEALIATATADGYRIMRLDTAWLNTEALAMYSSLGFAECAPYHEYPQDLMPHLRFMQRSLVADSTQ
jgi:putative acetyltransferase